MTFAKNALLAIFGFSSGAVIAAGVFAFITIIGVVPRLAQKTHTEGAGRLYEEVILLGGLFGCLMSFFDITIKLNNAVVVVLSLFNGIFIGCLAASLAETLNVIPILTRRTRLRKGLSLFVIALALGKLCGALLYFIIPGFFKS